jgi:DNA-binding transcriptional ArsR family regulator
MTIEVGTFDIDPARAAEFEPVIEDIRYAFATYGVPGLRSFTRSVDRPARYAVLVRLDSVADHRRFTESAEGARQQQLLRDYIVGQADIDHSRWMTPTHADGVTGGQMPLLTAEHYHELKSILQFVDRRPAPSLLPILRSQQQGEILALLLGDPELELSLAEIAERTRTPHPSVYREIQRAEQAGLVKTRRLGNLRLARANTDSPYYQSLSDVLTRAFGVPAVLTEALRSVQGIDDAYIYGSWAARHAGQPGRPVGDIDVLILGEPDRDQLFGALSAVEERLGRPVEATIREADWLGSGTGPFHETLTSRPLLRLLLADG